MVWYAWVMIAVHIVGALTGIGMIGKQRPPYTPMTAMIGTVISALWVAGIVMLAT